MKARDDFFAANFALRLVLFIRLEKKIDDLKEDDEGKSRNQKLPEWVGEFPNDPANVEAKAGGIAMDCANVQDATCE
jgi:hypothetical protein